MIFIHIIKFIACFVFSFEGKFFAGSFSLPNEPVATPRPLRNTIFSSVAKNPLSKNEATDLKSVAPAKTNITKMPSILQSSPADVPSFAVSSDLPKLSSSSAKNLPKQIISKNSPTTLENVKSEIKDLDTVQEVSGKPKEVIEEKSAQKDSELKHAQEDVHPHEDHEAKTVVDQKEHKETGVLYQNRGFVDDPATIAFNFEDASLQNLISYMEAVHNIKFVSEDVVPTAKDAKGVAGHKITFRTNRNLTRKESWDLSITFLHVAGLDVLPMMQEGFYRLVPLSKANNEPIPTYIGVDVGVLPDNDMIVRYMFFARNIDPAKIQPILNKMQSGSSKLDVYSDLKALIFTDRASSIKSLMRIVKELDRAALPEVLSVIKLKRANVEDVINLYNSLKPSSGAAGQPQKVWTTSKKESSLEYFPQDVVMVPYNRANSLILLGTAKDVERIEEFVTKQIDITVDRPVAPIFTYRLQYTNAKEISDLLSQVVTYGSSTQAGQFGGVRDGMKYLQKMSIVPDTWTNSLIINAAQEDYEAIKPLIAELDVAQKQVGLEVLIVQVKDVDTKILGAQLSGPNGQGSAVGGASPFGPTFLPSITAQTSGVAQGTPIVVTRGATGTTEDFSIKSSLASLLGNPILNEVGSILVTFGQPIWAIFKILKSITSTHIIANPFVVVSNNSSAIISSGEQRRLISGQVISSGTLKATGFTPVDANLKVSITPQINKNNVITLNIDVVNSQFTASLSGDQAGLDPRDSKEVKTVASVANGETLVIGGIMIENYASTSVGVPFLENIPIFGWFFKSKTRRVERNHFLIFVCPRVLDSGTDDVSIDAYTGYKLDEAQQRIDLINESDWFAHKKDPIQRAFFNAGKSELALQELSIGKHYKKQKAIDGKIDKKNKTEMSKFETKKSKKKKKQKEVEKAINNESEKAISDKQDQIIIAENNGQSMKNSISNSVQPVQGVKHAA